mgnify:CR=1 FL=1
MSNDKVRLICRCGTIWPICEMPISVDDMARAIKDARCPSCDKSSKTACIYVEKRDEREER